MSYQFDHRQLADEMEIYFFNEKIGAGLPMWLPNGVAIRDALERFVKDLEARAGYLRVSSPHIAKGELYEQSGHLKSFKGDMFPPLSWPEDESAYYLKPMNCPHHHMIFAASPRSFRQLPLRIAEYGQVYRFENSGALKGLSRVRGLCQNDAHIYVDPAHALSEIGAVLELHERCYQALGLEGYRYRLSLHDPRRPEDFEGAGVVAAAGDAASQSSLVSSSASENPWLRSEAILREALIAKGLPFFEAVGEAAFYGPKIDVQMKLSSGVEESVASVQLDFISPERFDLSFVSNDGGHKRPWIIHRAPLGSHERFVALLLEYFDGQLPGWLCPIQLYVLPVGDKARDEARRLADELIVAGVRARIDDRAGSLSKRVHLAHRSRPFAKLIIGERELASGEFKVQLREGEFVIDRESLANEFRKLVASPG